MNKKEYFPDGTLVDGWFYDTAVPALDDLGRQYVLTEHDIWNDGRVYTDKIQALIDKAAQNGGGVIVVPSGVFRTGALFFKQGVNLYIECGGVLLGSDDISDYPVTETRIEGETCKYYPALINADGVDGFVMCGKGTIDGNGYRSWRAFWLRREWNPDCTNKDEQRPRLVYISNSRNVTIAGLSLQNSHFWTTHIYRCERVKYLGCRITSQARLAPSTDAVDIDACRDVLIKDSYMAVNDDAVVLKGGKGPWADTAPENGISERVIIEDCEYGFCHSCFTCGSEAVHSKNIIMRRIHVSESMSLITLKMRPDTPQVYEYIRIEDITGRADKFLNINPWTQFFDLKDRKDQPLSYAENITIRNCDCECDIYFYVKPDKTQYELSDFTFENLNIKAKVNGYTDGAIDNAVVKNVKVTV